MAATLDKVSLAQAIDKLVASFPAELPAIIPTRQLPASANELAKLIDHTLLAPAATLEQVRDVCAQARLLGTATVCVNSSMIPTVAAELSGSDVKPISVVGFPFGSAVTESKVQETAVACQQGAQEIDMVRYSSRKANTVESAHTVPADSWQVQNVGLIKSREYLQVYSDILSVVQAAARSPTKAIVKVIIETSMLTRNEIIASTYLSCLAGAAFVKTSTGFGGGGAKAEDVRLMYAIANTLNVGWTTAPLIKASGGIRSLAAIRTMVENGASRIGASGTQAILDEVVGVQPASSINTAGY